MKYYIKKSKYDTWQVGQGKGQDFIAHSEFTDLEMAEKKCNELNGIGDNPKINKGITLRDYFAGMAMQVLIKDFGIESTAQKAYSYADAMLAERSRTNE